MLCRIKGSRLGSPSGEPALPFVPYREPRRKPKRKPLDRAQVVRAALALLDEEGLDALTMRRLAERLGIKAASLYKHVRDKDELLVLLADEIAGEIPTPAATGPWKERLAEAARNYRRGLLAHRDGARLAANTAPFGPRRLRHIETVLGILRSSGLSDREAARASHHFNNFVTEFAADEARHASAAAALGMTPKRMLAMARSRFRSLSADDYPLLVRLADHLVEDEAEGPFEFGLQLWLDALAALAGRRG